MPRHSAPNHPDCCIDCPAGGFAYYISPFGPCKTGCDPQELVDAIVDSVRKDGWQTISSGSVRGITRRQVGELGRRLRRLGTVTPNVIRDLLGDLEKIGSQNGRDRLDAYWEEVDVEKTLEGIRNAAGSTDGSPLATAG